jgi:hypothetical protein
MVLVVSSKIVVLCDMQTSAPHSAHFATAWDLQTEHLAIRFHSLFLRPTDPVRATQNS